MCTIVASVATLSVLAFVGCDKLAARTAIEQGDDALAKGISTRPLVYTLAIDLKSESALAYSDRASVYEAKRDFDEAIADRSQAIRLEPKSAKWYGSRWHDLHEHGGARQGDCDLKQGHPHSNQNAMVASRGYYYMSKRKRDLDKAIADYTEAIRLAPNDPYQQNYNNRASAYMMKGDYNRAIADHTEAIRLAPNNPLLYNNRAFVYMAKGDYDKAIADFTQGIRFGPSNPLPYYERGLAYEHKGNYDKAIADYTEAIRRSPKFAPAYSSRGVLYERKGKKDNAEADFAEAKKLGFSQKRAAK